MTSEIRVADDQRRWTVHASVVAVLFVASLVAAAYYWPRDTHDNLQQEQASATTKANVSPERATHVDPKVIRRQAWDKIARRLAPADAASLAAIERSLKPVDEFFADRRMGAKAFAKSVVGWSGKWKYVKTRRVFGGDADKHLEFLDEKFREHVFTPDELTAVVQSSISDYVNAVQGVENKLLVQCRSDIEDIDPAIGSVVGGLSGGGEFAASYKTILEGLAHEAALGAATDAGQFVGSLVAAEVTQQLTIRLGQAIATRLGVSAGVLGAGATGSALSAGATIGLAIVIDMGLDWVMSAAGADAESRITAKVEDSLDKLRDFIIDGDPTAVAAYHKIGARRGSFPTAQGREKIESALARMEAKGDLGLRRMLMQVHQQRARLREAALRQLVLGESSS
jgi:hypothetical protein